jgi:hypothetical protein
VTRPLIASEAPCHVQLISAALAADVRERAMRRSTYSARMSQYHMWQSAGWFCVARAPALRASRDQWTWACMLGKCPNMHTRKARRSYKLNSFPAYRCTLPATLSWGCTHWLRHRGLQAERCSVTAVVAVDQARSHCLKATA